MFRHRRIPEVALHLTRVLLGTRNVDVGVGMMFQGRCRVSCWLGGWPQDCRFFGNFQGRGHYCWSAASCWSAPAEYMGSLPCDGVTLKFLVKNIEVVEV